MFARVSTIQGKPERVEEVVRFFEKAVPKGLEGMKGGYFLVNRKTGKIMSISLWETEKAMQASASMANKIRGQATETASAAPPIAEMHEGAVKL